MAVNEEWGRQLRAALRDYEARHDARLSYSEIARRVGAELGRTFAPTSARAWFVEGQEPESFAVAAAIAHVLEADPGDLAFPKRKQGSAVTTRGGQLDRLAAEPEQPVADVVRKQAAKKPGKGKRAS